MSSFIFTGREDLNPEDSSLTPEERLKINLGSRALWGTVQEYAMVMKVSKSECVDLLSTLFEKELIAIRMFSNGMFHDIVEESVKHLKDNSVIEVIWLEDGS